MSGVYIKDMEMPTSCPCELLGIGYDLYCSFVAGIPARAKEYYECCQNGTRPSWCPLVPVPPHGRLRDLDKLEKHFRNARLYHSDDSNSGPFIAAGISQCLDILNGSLTPTIIPAEEGET